ncbi:Hypothetical predicted protein [Cloeon dipterum]|uniref:Peptidase S1 domain-containing protein n=1 Tax=Cloeon dipterum TaxID=197152 RepID=A0A8S1E0J5_9INSE|nr:Hypothetical predicted protein [Cloeon dipterum]
MKTVIALSLILVVAAQAVDWRQKPSYRNAPRASHANSKNIIRGHVAPPGRFLFQVEIYTDGGTYSRCGGSLIKEDKVLTAAHCCDGARSFDVLLGANNPDIFEPRRETVTATRFTKHEKYRSSILDYDVCIIHLDGVVSGEGIATIRLPSRSQAKKLEIFKGSTATVSGWGSTSNASNTRSTKLMYADVTIMDSKKCKKTYKKNVINERKICTYNADGSGFCRVSVNIALFCYFIFTNFWQRRETLAAPSPSPNLTE